MKKAKLLAFFLIINLGSLALGSWLMNNGPRDAWYTELNKAPWTPPGWVFGITWSLIMVCFSIYLSELFTKTNHTKTKIAYGIQILLNVGWNYVFFNQHQTALGLLILLFLNILLCYFFFNLKEYTQKTRFLLLPYMIWMCIATSLNLYILIHN